MGGSWKIKLENEKLGRQYEELQEEYKKESNRAAFLRSIAWKVAEANKILQKHLNKNNSRIQEYEAQAEGKSLPR